MKLWPAMLLLQLSKFKPSKEAWLNTNFKMYHPQCKSVGKFKYVGTLPWAPGGGWLYFILTAMKVCFYKK